MSGTGDAGRRRAPRRVRHGNRNPGGPARADLRPLRPGGLLEHAAARGHRHRPRARQGAGGSARRADLGRERGRGARHADARRAARWASATARRRRTCSRRDDGKSVALGNSIFAMQGELDVEGHNQEALRRERDAAQRRAQRVRLAGGRRRAIRARRFRRTRPRCSSSRTTRTCGGC